MYKIMHIVRANAISGAENHIFMLLAALKNEYNEIILLNLFDNEISDGYREKIIHLEMLGIKIYMKKISGKADIRAIPSMYKIIKNEKPNVIHTHMPYADLFGAFAAKLAKTQFVVSSRHYDYSTSKIEELKFKIYYRVANCLQDTVIPISEKVAELCREVEGLKKERINKVLYGCEEQAVDKSIARRKILKELMLNDEKVILGTVARLISWKGHKYMIKAMTLLDKNILDKIVWLVVGDGNERNNLEVMAKENGILDKCIFMGNRSDVPELMATMDVLVHPTLGEGFGLILLEAMIQKTPIISTKTGAIPEVIKDGESGILVEAKNSKLLAEAIQKIIENEVLRKQFGEKGRDNFENKFTVKIMVENIKKIYEYKLEYI